MKCRRPLSITVLALVATLAIVPPVAQALFPYPAGPNRCDSSGLPLGCIPLANEMAAQPAAATVSSGASPAPASAPPIRSSLPARWSSSG